MPSIPKLPKLPKGDDGLSQPSSLEALLLFQIRVCGLPAPVREYRFAPPRKWRFDLAYTDPQYRLAIELEGGVFKHGWHQSIQRYLSDCEKYTEAAVLGWRVLRFAADRVKSGEAVTLIEKILRGH